MRGLLSMLIFLAGSSLGFEQEAKAYNVLLLIIDDASPIYHSVFQESPVQTPNLERR